ncbi:hypothetical protein EDC04DRAFT_448276 [Pisolithus marmoratus]|nr:hypothetical protein EDC04DRAFT_448276 [Pisolithus marmoratus]
MRWLVPVISQSCDFGIISEYSHVRFAGPRSTSRIPDIGRLGRHLKLRITDPNAAVHSGVTTPRSTELRAFKKCSPSRPLGVICRIKMTALRPTGATHRERRRYFQVHFYGTFQCYTRTCCGANIYFHEYDVHEFANSKVQPCASFTIQPQLPQCVPGFDSPEKFGFCGTFSEHVFSVAMAYIDGSLPIFPLWERT